jgi:hypothetical protein
MSTDDVLDRRVLDVLRRALRTGGDPGELLRAEGLDEVAELLERLYGRRGPDARKDQ